jgi:RNA polymerase sigma-70 factor (ECF subfamily)
MEDRSARDRELIGKVLGGDDRPFEELASSYQNLVTGTLWKYGIDREDIEDVASEVFMKLYRNLHRYRPDHSFSSWLYRLTANHAIDSLRRGKRDRKQVELPAEIASRDPGASDALERNERAVLLRRGIQKIPGRYREAIILVYIDGMKLDEAAELLDLPIGTVKTRLMRGRKVLRRFLVRHHPEVFGGADAM